MTFAAPLFFLALLFIPLRLWLHLLDRRRGEGAFRFSSLAAVGRKRSLRAATSGLPVILQILGASLLIVAMARPQKVTTMASDDRYGIDIVIALDASGSMAAEDFRPRNRFAVAKELIGRFIEKRENDRIGIVTFGVRAATRVPITYDRQIARDILSRAEIGQNGDGTAIGQGIATAVNRLRTSKSRSKVIILLTDGVNNAGAIEPVTATALATKFGIRIYTIGVGSQGEVPIPIKMQNPLTGEIETEYQMIRADLDEAMLSEVASKTGGTYFRAVDSGALDAILSKIDQLEKSRLSPPRTRTIDELYPRPLMGGLALLALAVAMSETAWMRLPS